MEIGLGFVNNQQTKEMYIFFILPQNLLQSKQLHNTHKKKHDKLIFAILCVEFPQVH